MARTLGPQLAVVLLVAAVAAAGCGGPSGGAAKALDRYGQALRDKNYERAYELMSSSFRAKVSREEFVRMMRDNPREVGETRPSARSHGSRRSTGCC